MDTNLLNSFIVGVFTLVVIPLLVRPIVAKVAPLIEAREKQFWANISVTNKQTLETIVADARLAFANLNANGQITDALNKERDYVIKQVQLWFDAHGFVIDVSTVINEFAKQVELGLQDSNKAQG